MSETQINDNQLALNSETGSFAEMIFATQVGKEQIAQALTSKGTQTASTETLVQMADKISALNTNNSVMYGKGKNILDSITSQNVTSVRGLILLKNNYALISTTTTGYVCDLSQEYDDWSDFLGSAAVTITWNEALSGNEYDLVSASEDSCTIARAPKGYYNTSIEFYDLAWNNGVPTSMTYLKTSSGTNKQLYSSPGTGKFAYHPSQIFVSNDRKLVAYRKDTYTFILESYEDDSIYAGTTGIYLYGEMMPYDISVNGDSVSVFYYWYYESDSYRIRTVTFNYTLEYTGNDITSISYNNYTTISQSFGEYSFYGSSSYTTPSMLYLKEQKILLILTQKWNNLNLTASSTDRLPQIKLFAYKLPSASNNTDVLMSLDLGAKYKKFHKNTSSSSSYDLYISSYYSDNSFYYISVFRMQLAQFLCKTQNIDANTVRVYMVSGQSFDIDFRNNTITDSTASIVNYAEPNADYRSKVVLFKQNNASVYYGLRESSYISVITLNPSGKEIITDIELNYNNTPVCIYPLQVNTNDINGLVQETLEVPVP